MQSKAPSKNPKAPEAETEMIPIDDLRAGDIVVTKKSGTRLTVHALQGLPDDRFILGKREDGTLECWPLRDLPEVRIIARPKASPSPYEKRVATAARRNGDPGYRPTRSNGPWLGKGFTK